MRRSSFIAALAALLSLVIFGTSAVAQEELVPHEDPEAAEVVYDGIAILGYCSALVDEVLARRPEAVETLAGKRPFANVPGALEVPLDDAAEASVSIARLIVGIEGGLETLGGLARQFRLAELETVRQQVRGQLALARGHLRVIDESAARAGKELNVPQPGSGSPLRVAYDELLGRINRLRDLLALFEKLLGALPEASLEELLGTLPGASLEELLGALPEASLEELLEAVLQPTDISFAVEPTRSFVGEEVEFRGSLASDGTPLPNREIVLLLDGVPYLRTMTGPEGSYRGRLQIPYRYVPAITLASLYIPQGGDIGRFLASRSAPVEVQVLFHEATLKLSTAGEAYPGRTSQLRGSFDYGDAPPPAARDVQAYLDGVLVSREDVGREFQQSIAIAPDTGVGRHRLLVVAPAQGRYAPVSAEVVLSVAKAVPVVEMSPPAVLLMPFPVELRGRIRSELGPLQVASVEISLAERTVTVQTSEDGAFNARLGTGMSMGLIGSRALEVRVSPSEPWNSPTSASWSLVVVNPVLMAAIVLLLALSAAPLARRARALPVRRLRVRPGSAPSSSPERAVPVSSESGRTTVPPGGAVREERDLRGLILGLYGRLLGFLQGLTGIVLRPELTLREFAARCAPWLGPGQEYLESFTRLVERLLYSRHSPGPAEVEWSRQLSQQVEESAKGDLT